MVVEAALVGTTVVMVIGISVQFSWSQAVTFWVRVVVRDGLR